MSLREQYVDFEPLEEWLTQNVEGMGNYAEGGLASVLSKPQAAVYFRARAAGRLTVLAADKLAIALGAHPFQIWPNWFDLALAEAAS